MAIKQIIFSFEVIDKNKKYQKGELTASSLSQARNKLIYQGYIILKIHKKSSFYRLHCKKIQTRDIAIFTRQLATLINAGLPIVQSLSIMTENTNKQELITLIKKIKSKVESGTSFSEVLQLHPTYFDTLYCHLVKSGEQAGTLDIMLQRIAFYKEKSETLKRKIKKALYYPITVLTTSILVTGILLIKIVPTFQSLFDNFGGTLPFCTRFFLNLSGFLQKYSLIFLVILLLLLCYGYNRYRKNRHFRQSLQSLYLKSPILGILWQKTITARFCRTLATMSAAGVPLMDSMETISKSIENILYQNATKKIQMGLAIGQSMSVVVRQTGFFPPLVSQMIHIGEESGTLEQMLDKLAIIYEEEVNLTIDGLTSMLEPLIIIILGVIVGSLIIAMYLPIFAMGSLF